MQPYNVSESDFTQLLKETGPNCITIIVPLQKFSPDRKIDLISVKRAIVLAKESLRKKVSREEAQLLEQSLDDTFSQINFVFNREGIGIYVSPHVKQVVSFFFPVMGKVVLANSFELKDLIYQHFYDRIYYVLLLREKLVRLFEGQFNRLKEVNNDHFPLILSDDYEYSKPVKSPAYKGYGVTKDIEKDKSLLQQIRYKRFFNKVNDLLKPYVSEAIPLVLAGDSKELSWFKKYSKHAVAAEVEGNYFFVPHSELGDLSWQSVKAFLDHEKEGMVQKFRENWGTDTVVSGVDEVWQAVRERSRDVLLVEKDFVYLGALQKAEPSLFQPAHHSEPLMESRDVVPQIIETVLQKGGKVIVVDNGTLASFGRIGMLTRF